ncbi:MAG: hypothetical protein KDA96_20625, partial [Planctomycetaceae bacterium]|nr:hypothetical protein [Planctomycetaceae bacterium]
MKKLNGAAIGQFFVNHGEKVGAGVAGLLAVWTLLGASWIPCGKDPLAITQAVDRSKAEWLQKGWPEEEVGKFANTPNIAELAERMAAPQGDISGLALNNGFNDPLIRVTNVLSAFDVLAPERPEATGLAIPIALLPEEALEEESEEMTETKEDAEKEKDEVDPSIKDLLPSAPPGGQFGGPAGPGGYGGAPNYPGGGSGYGTPPGYPGGSPGGMSPGGLGMSPGGMGMSPGGMGMSPGGMGMSPGGMGMSPGGMGMSPGGMGMGGMGMGEGGYGYGGDMYSDFDSGFLGTNVDKKRIRFSKGISVRFVIDFYKQTELASEAMRKPAEVVQQMLSYTDLVIERKQRSETGDPWAGEWEPLSVEDLGEILEESLAFDMDIVLPGVTRDTITMPLPRRATGAWSKEQVSHKALENVALSESEKRAVQKFYEKLMEQQEGKESRAPQRARKGGFHGFQKDVGSMMSMYDMGSGGEDFYSDMSDIFNTGSDSPQNDEAPKSKEEIKEKIDRLKPTAFNRLLLVRFMDFTVVPGNSYIYRCRVAIQNPYQGRAPDELEQPELALQPLLLSDWSPETSPVYVPQSYRYYLVEADARPGVRSEAKVAMYYEHPEAGMPVMADMKVEVGTRIGGRRDTDVIDLSVNNL